MHLNRHHIHIHTYISRCLRGRIVYRDRESCLLNLPLNLLLLLLQVPVEVERERIVYRDREVPVEVEKIVTKEVQVEKRVALLPLLAPHSLY